MKSKTIQMHKLTFEQQQSPTVELKKMLDDSTNLLVVSHIDPDGDALGTQIAFARYLKDNGKNVTLVRQSDIPEKYNFMEAVKDIPHIDSMPNEIKFDTVVALECPDFKRIGLASKWISEDTKLINIDHHRDNNLVACFNWINIKASSVGEMAYEYFEAVGYTVDKEVATCLLAAILTDTGRFRYNCTSQRTLEIAGKLVGAGAVPQTICDEIYFKIKPSSVTLLGKVLNGIEFHHDGKLCMLTLTKQMLADAKAESSESDGLVDNTLYSQGVEVGLLLKEFTDTKTKVSMRSKDAINVSAVAGQFGGGGHYNASGCLIEKSLAETKQILIDIYKEKLNA